MAGAAHGRWQHVSADQFHRRFRFLILLTWLLPPVVGVGFLLYVHVFTVEQMVVIMTGPLTTPFITAAVFVTLWYFTRLLAPTRAFLAETEPTQAQWDSHLAALERFSPRYWAVFILYLIGASSTVALSADLFADMTVTLETWFRVHLVGLIVSVIVGLPIFFRMLDLFGLTLRGFGLEKPVFSMRSKVLMLGAMMPLLVDTLLVQYYWSRTGYFSTETFVVWVGLEVIAIVGSLMFVRSLSQSLAPLTRVIGGGQRLGELSVEQLVPFSTDELGLLAGSYQRLIRKIQAHNAILQVGAKLNASEGSVGIGPSIDRLLEIARQMLRCDTVMLLLRENDGTELVAVALSDAPYSKAGHFRLAMDRSSLPVKCFKEGKTQVVPDVQQAEEAAHGLCEKHGIRSILCAPLKVGGQVIGVLLGAETGKLRSYQTADIALIEQIAEESAVAISTHWLLDARARAQRAAEASEDQVRLLLDSTVEAIYGADTDGICTFVNQACLDMLGYEREDELLGKSIHEVIHHSYPDGRHYPKQDCLVRHATLRGEIGHSDQEVHWRKDGTPVPVEYWSHPVYKDGELKGAVVAFIDISERRAAEQDMRHLLARNELLLESTSDGIIGVDAGLRCTFANSAAARMLGYQPDELVGQDLYQQIHKLSETGMELRREDLPLCRAIAGEVSQHTDNAVLWQKSGEFIPVQYSANPIFEEGRITGAVMVFRNIAEARAVARKMDYLATHDPLTGLFNRREFESRLEQALLSARHHDSAHALCYLDLDQFKVVNDTCGHEAGDELLRQLATLLHGSIRQHDMLARLGGDEFGLLLDSCPIGKALAIADELRTVIEDYRFAWQDKTFAVGVSIGMVAITAETESISWALSSADTACYVAKDSGRNRVHVYELHDDELNKRRSEMQWVSRLNEALDRDQLILRFQPIVPVASPDERRGAIEILVAMREPGGREIPPGAFIPAAERYNLMVAVDRWVVGKVFAWLREHHARLDGVERCFINLSGQSIGQEKFLGFLIEELGKGGFPAEMLCFEVTETAAVANLSRAVMFIKALKTYGCRFALDDFGSGMSSFAYLKALPLDYLKIDGNFVRDMVTDPIDRAMVQAIHQVGHVMNIATIAEFVEDQAILDELRAIGIDHAQGYGIAKPQPLSDFFERPT